MNNFFATTFFTTTTPDFLFSHNEYRTPSPSPPSPPASPMSLPVPASNDDDDYTDLYLKIIGPVAGVVVVEVVIVAVTYA